MPRRKENMLLPTQYIMSCVVFSSCILAFVIHDAPFSPVSDKNINNASARGKMCFLVSGRRLCGDACSDSQARSIGLHRVSILVY